VSGRSSGVVRSFDPAEGWGVIDGPDVPGGCFVWHASIQMPGYRTLTAGQRVTFSFEGPLSFLQDGCPYRALEVVPEG
jgi:CspA family cold shock protein